MRQHNRMVLLVLLTFLAGMLPVAQPAMPVMAATMNEVEANERGEIQTSPQATCPISFPVGEVFDCEISIVDEVDTYSLVAQQNDRWFFRVQRTAGTLQPRMRLFDPNNNEVCSNYTPGAYTDISCDITTNGTYTLQVRDRSNSSGRTGTYLVYGQRVNKPANTTSVAFGSQTEASIEYGLEDDVYQFTADINDKINVRVWRDAGAMQPGMYLYDSVGNQLCGSYTPGVYVGLNCTINKTDTYFIFIRDRNVSNTGTYTLHIQRRNNPGNAVPLSYGVPIDSTISVPAEMDTYTFTADANDQTFLRVKRTSGNLTPDLYVYDASGDAVCGNYTPGTFTDFDCSIDTSGTYTVVMDDHGNEKTGSYTLYLQRKNNPGNAVAMAFGQTLDGEIEAVGAFDTYTVLANENDVINISLARTAGDINFWVGVYNPVGERICYNYTSSARLSISNCVISDSGQHTVLVFDRADDAVGTYSIRLHSNSNDNTSNTCTCPVVWLTEILCQNVTTTLARTLSSTLLQDAANLDLDVFYGVRDVVLNPTPAGQRYIGLYNTHAPEITGLISQDTALQEQAVAALNAWQPNLSALANGNGDTVTITAEQMQTMNTFLDNLAAAGSAELQAVIAEERQDINDLAGQTMTAAEESVLTDEDHMVYLPFIVKGEREGEK